MLQPLVRRLRRGSIRSKVRQAIDAGVGVYNGSWDLPVLPGKEKAASRTGSWSGAMSPWRVCVSRTAWSHVTLVLAVVGPENQEVVTLGFGVLRPQDFYGEGDVTARPGEV